MEKKPLKWFTIYFEFLTIQLPIFNSNMSGHSVSLSISDLTIYQAVVTLFSENFILLQLGSLLALLTTLLNVYLYKV